MVMALAGVVAWIPELLHPQFYFHDDMQLYFVPHIVEIGRQLRAGQFPLLSEYSWLGGALAGEYQPAIFSLPHLLLCWLVANLEPRTMASVASIGYIALAGGGAYRAARLSGFSTVLAVSIAGVAALNGFNLAWSCWLPAISGWAWLMWSWWGLVRLRCRPVWCWSDLAIAALFIYATLAAGWPLFSLLLLPAALYVQLSVPAGKSRHVALLGAAGALLLGALLAAPALLCLVEYTRESSRTDVAGRGWGWTVPLSALKGLVVPFSHGKWSTFVPGSPHQNLEMAGGVVPPLVLLATLVLGDRARRKAMSLAALLGVVVLVCSMLPSVPPLRWPFRWLPIAHVLLVIAGAQALRAQAAGLERDVMAYRTLRWAGLLGLGWVTVVVALEPADMRLLVLSGVACLSCVALIFTHVLRLAVPTVFGACVLVNVVATWLVQPRRDTTPYWHLDDCAAVWAATRPADLYFGVFIWDSLLDPAERGKGNGGCLAPGNLPMVFERRNVGGYSPLLVDGFHKTLDMAVHGELGIVGLRNVVQHWSAPGSLFDRWGIAGLVVPQGVSILHERLASQGWRSAEALTDGAVWRRTEVSPERPLLESVERVRYASSASDARTVLRENGGRDWVLVPRELRRGVENGTVATYAPATVKLENATTTRIEAQIATARDKAALLVVHRPYYAGYRATFAGAALDVGRADGVMIALELPPGQQGKLTLEYAPWGTRWPGVMAAAVGLIGLLGMFGVEVWRRSHRQRFCQTPSTDLPSE
jgi:hypothetical protein